VTVKYSLFRDLNLIMRKLSIDKEIDVKCLLDQGKLYTEITRGCGISKATVSRIKVQHGSDRPCNEPGHPKILKNRY
jgi:uncharacterized protein YerC